MKFPRALAQAGAALIILSRSAVTATALGAVSGTEAGAATKLPSCNLSALAKHKGVVNITFWNSMVDANGHDPAPPSPPRSMPPSPRST